MERDYLFGLGIDLVKQLLGYNSPGLEVPECRFGTGLVAFMLSSTSLQW